MIPFTLIRKNELRLLKLQNATLRDALRNANEELARHRRLLNDLRQGDPEVTRIIERLRHGAAA